MELSQIGQVAVRALDLERATAFYRDTLGLPFLFAVPGLAFFDCHGVRLMLDRPEGEFDHASSVLYFKTADIHGDTVTLKARGVEFVQDPHLIAKMPDHELWMSFFRDSEGNVHALMSEIRQGTDTK